MGWTGKEIKNQEELQKEIKYIFGDNLCGLSTVKYPKNQGDSTVMYALMPDNSIVVVLAENEGDQIWIKDMHESAQPFYYGAPKKWLNLASDGACPQWREDCVSRNEMKSYTGRGVKCTMCTLKKQKM